MAAHTKLDRSDIEGILNNYRIGTLKSFSFFKRGAVNTNIKLTTSGGFFVLKVVEARTQEDLKFQLELIKYLRTHGIKVSEHIGAENGAAYVMCDKKPVVLFRFVEGAHVTRARKVLWEDVVYEVVRLKRSLRKFKPGNAPWIKYANNYSAETQWQTVLGRNKYWPIFQKIMGEMESVDYGNLRKAIVHGDLSETNILAAGNKVAAIIDFDEARLDYTVYDMAIFIAQTCFAGNKLERNFLKYFLEQYSRFEKLNVAEKKALFLFIRRRLVSSIMFFDYLLKLGKGDSRQNLIRKESFEKRYAEILKLGPDMLMDFLNS